jgi:hypothetical protein
MKIGRFTAKLTYSMLGVLVLFSLSASRATAQDDHSHSIGAAHHDQTPAQRKQANALVETVREATKHFHQTSPPDGYSLVFGCVSGGDFGAMGMHFLNGSLLDGEVVPDKPEILLYEPLPNGRIRLTGADFLVDKKAWEANPEHTGPPELNGQLFHLFDSPNRFGLDPFYTLHVWAWKDNPVGTFSNWNPNVSCDAFNGGNR